MADLLGSLLPAGYSAPGVQSVLGGELLDGWCYPSGSTPISECREVGYAPGAGCIPWGTGPLDS